MNSPETKREQEFELVEGLKSALESSLSCTLYYDSSGSLVGETAEEEAEKLKLPLFVSCRITNPNLMQIKIGAARSAAPHGMVDLKEVLESISKLEGQLALENEIYTITLYEAMNDFSPGQLRMFENKLAAVRSMIELIYRNILRPDIASLQHKYKDYPGLSPVLPMVQEGASPHPELETKLDLIVSFLSSGLSVALTSDSIVVKDYFLAHLAAKLMKSGASIASNMHPVPLRGLPDMIQKSPGYIEFTAVSLSTGASPYEMGEVVETIMAVLKKQGKPAIFTGSYSELQGIYGLGQGNLGDPINPVLVKLDPSEIELTDILDFQLSANNISPGRKNMLREQMSTCISSKKLKYSNVDLIPALIQGSSKGEVNVEKLLTTLKSPTETFRGFAVAKSRKRNLVMQQNLVNGIECGQLGNYLREQLIGQDKAIKQIEKRLSSEIINRKQQEPIRVLCQGLPGTGKTEVSKLLASFLGIPYKNIDASNFTTGYDLRSTLFGSSTGIVQSYNPGLLELAAGHSRGCVVEVSDIDHAKTESIRSQIGDSFLSVLQEGIIQTATGRSVYCGNVIFVFTINLPGQADEKVLKGMGFRSDLSEKEIFHNTMKEMKKLFSSAFISRIGKPILYSSFSKSEQVLIAEMALRKGMDSCFENLFMPRREVIIGEGSGECLLRTFFSTGEYIGARQIYEHTHQFLAEEIGNRISEFREADPSEPVKIFIKKNHLVLDF